jgi:hypothetical protein
MKMFDKIMLSIGVLMFAGALAYATTETGDQNFTGEVNMDGIFKLKNSAVTATAANLNLSGTTIKTTVNTEVAVTNNQTVTLAAGQVNVLKSTGVITGFTNTILLAVAPAADVGKITIIQNGSTASNVLAIAAATGFYSGPVIDLASNQCAIVLAVATNKYVSVGNQ